MNLRKDAWELVKLGNVCEKVRNVDIRKQEGTFNYIDIGSIDSNQKRVSEVQELDWQNASSRARQIIKQGDTLFSTVRVNLERIAIIDKGVSNAIASTGFTVIRANEKAHPNFLFYAVSAPDFIFKVSKLQKGTAYPAVTDNIVFNQEILLPSLEEQKQIAALFQSIEAAIEQVGKQEKNLTLLLKSLVNGLLKDEPAFGNLLNEQNCTPTLFAAIAECDKRYEEHNKPVTRFVGLENIDSENFQLQGWGNLEKGTTFTKRFVKGDVLFGKRRAYLKKVAIADFDGICSNDILVLRAKNEQILPQLLPFYVSADAFIQHAVSTSAGSLSPRTKWKDLSELQVLLPDLETQKQIVDVLNDILSTTEQLKQQRGTLKNLKQKLLSEILG